MFTKNKIKIKEFLIELFVVFIGVYLAFQLNNYKENIYNDKIKNNYYKVLLKDFHSNLFEIQQAKNKIETFISEIDSGISPNPMKIKEIDLTNNLFLLKSAFNSGYLENIESQYIINISFGSNHLVRTAKFIDNYNHTIKAVLVKNDFDTLIFYNDNGILKENYNWIKTDLKFISNYLYGLEKGISKGAIPDTKALIK